MKSKNLLKVISVVTAMTIFAQTSIAQGTSSSTKDTINDTTTLKNHIIFAPSILTLASGEATTVKATVYDNAGKEIQEPTVEWELADPSMSSYLKLVGKGSEITVVALAPSGTSSSVRPNNITVIATYKTSTQTISKALIIKLIEPAVPAGPIPPGIDPQVDLMWSVLPDQTVHDNFGKKISKEYYCINILIGNNSGYDLQIAGIGFTVPKLTKNFIPKANNNMNYMIPSMSYKMVRGTMLRAQEVGTRSRVMNVVTALGPVLAGFTPFFRALNARTNYVTGVNIFSNPFASGAKLVAPDTTIGQLERLDDQAFRDDDITLTIVRNNDQARITTFFPKEFFKGDKGASNQNDWKNWSPKTVMLELGELVLVGDLVQHINRVRVANIRQNDREYSISGRVTDNCGNGLENAEVVLIGGAFFKETKTKTDSNGNYQFEAIPVGDDYKLSAMFSGATKITSVIPESFKLLNDKTNVNFKVELGKYSISGKVTNVSAKGLNDVELTLLDETGKEIIKKKTEADGTFKFDSVTPSVAYKITVPDKDNKTQTIALGLLNCNKKDVNVVVAK